MKTKLFALLGLPGLALVGLVSSAAAQSVASVQVILEGTVTSSADPKGLFGCTVFCSQASNPFKGDSYQAAYGFAFNPDDFYAIANGSSDAWQIGLEGGSLDAPLLTSPLLIDFVTISGPHGSVRRSIDPSQNGGLFMFTNGGLPWNAPGALPYTLVANVTDDVGDQIYSTATSSSFNGFNIAQNFGPLSVSPGYSEICLGGSCADFIEADITLSMRVLYTVPEPSTWMLMMIGFAGLGYVGYRNAKSGRSAFAA